MLTHWQVVLSWCPAECAVSALVQLLLPLLPASGLSLCHQPSKVGQTLGGARLAPGRDSVGEESGCSPGPCSAQAMGSFAVCCQPALGCSSLAILKALGSLAPVPEQHCAQEPPSGCTASGALGRQSRLSPPVHPSSSR